MTPRNSDSFATDALIICALYAVAIAQPLYDLLGQSPTFFVAHSADRWDILALVLVVSIAIPALFVTARAAMELVGAPLRRVLNFLLISSLASAFVLVTLNKFVAAGAWLILGSSGFAGMALAFLLLNSRPLRQMTAIISIGALLFPAIFLCWSPVSGIVFQSNALASTESRTDATTPVVLVVFDELNPLGLLDESRNIDPVRFPNIAALAETAWWFPNASSVHPQSEKAVPAIFTGRFPTGDDVVPSLAGYPDNLFTLLGADYDLNVMETFTALCPVTYCPQAAEAGNKFDAAAFASDIRVILAHMLFPRALAKKYLPALDEGWRGFGSQNAEHAITEGAGLANLATDAEKQAVLIAGNRMRSLRHLDKTDAFRQFVARIKPGLGTLDTIHLVFPHAPYYYLPDGGTYNYVPIGPLWKSQVEADLAYHQYLMQLGAADTLIGELTSRLKALEKFDQAMVILVADHGAAFRGGTPKRSIAANPSVLHIPLLIKLPYQNQSQISDKFVLNIDVLPTIADVLGIEIPWQLDGVSVFAENYPARDTIRVTHAGRDYQPGKTQRVNFDAVPGRLEKFGVHTPLMSLSLKGPHSDLIGADVEELTNVDTHTSESPRLAAKLDEFSSVDISSGYLPALFKGRVLTTDTAQPYWIAVALNGTVAAISPTIPANQSLQFSMLIAPDAFRQGPNDVRVFLVSGASISERRILEVGLQEEAYSLDSDEGTDILRTATGEQFTIAKTGPAGELNRIDVAEGEVTFRGWAAQPSPGTVAMKVVMFLDGKYFGSVFTGVRRPGLVARFNSKIIDSGFELEIPSGEWHGNADGLRLFGIYPDGVAVEILKRLPKEKD